MCESEQRQADAQDVIVTPAMIEAGVLAAEFEDYDYGWGQEEALVKRVYLAMRDVALCRSSERIAAEGRGARS